MLQILNAPNEVLSQKSVPVKKIDKNLIEFINGMKKALEKAQDPIGVGLASPQVGKNIRIFIAKPTLKSKIYVFINPKILESETNESQAKNLQKSVVRSKKLRKLEGCLSLKDIWGEVKRDSFVTVEYVDEKGKKYTKSFTGFMSTIIQHEIDHLEGILFPRRVLEQNGTLYKSEKDEKGQDIFEEIKI
ncbi:MAG: peptide deformylase [Candidatus Levybacteria bacterium RBG_13_35_9]|nr:MAG: peptide deformylase [Candidatus Levybacteria bacterium RBG_13_35_9]